MRIRQYVNPDTWWSYLTTIPNDGNDYDVVFEGGSYEVPSTVFGNVIVDHALGGSITLRAAIKHDPVITTARQTVNLYLHGDRIHMDGLKWVADPYPTTNPIVRIFRMWMGGWTPGGGRTYPTELNITRCYMDGSQLRFPMIGSIALGYYTNMLVDDCVVRNGGGGSTFQVQGDYMHAWIRNVDAETINGPDAGTTAHYNGCQWLEIIDLNGESTANVNGCRALSTITGRQNHDMHSIRVNRIKDKRVRININDSVLKGHWREGSVGTSVGVKGITHLFYYHTNPNDYPTIGERPVIAFDNVTLESRIGQVPVDEYYENATYPYRDLVWLNDSASYEFWDCTFRWVMDPEAPTEYNNSTMCAVRDASDNYDLTMHNCTFDLPSNAVHWLGAGFTNRVITETTNSRGYKDENWMRVETPSFPSRVNEVHNPSFEDDIYTPETWWLGAAAPTTIESDGSPPKDNAFDGDKFCRILMYLNDPFGAPDGLGSLTSAATTLTPAIDSGVELYLRFRVRYRALEQHDSTNRTGLTVYMLGTDHVYGTRIIDPNDLHEGWNLIEVILTATSPITTLTMAFAGHTIFWGDFTKPGREQWDVDMVELYREAD